MKVCLLAAIYMMIYFGCSDSPNQVNFTSIKVFTTYSADTVTPFNKDLGIGDYLFYNSNTDSFTYRNLTDIDPNQYKTYVGHLNNKLYVDTLVNLIWALRKYKNGIIPANIDTNTAYCGPEFYVEYQDRKGEHYHLFILDNNDTLNQFSDFFYRLEKSLSKKTQVSNSIVKSDSEAVSAMRKLGVYEKKETPYIPLQCEQEIDKTKIYGAWRTVGSKYDRTRHSYDKMTFKQNGIYIYESIEEGHSTKVRSGRFMVSTKDNTFILKTKKEYKFKVLKLTNTCFEYTKEDDGDIIRFDRL